MNLSTSQRFISIDGIDHYLDGYLWINAMQRPRTLRASLTLVRDRMLPIGSPAHFPDYLQFHQAWVAYQNKTWALSLDESPRSGFENGKVQLVQGAINNDQDWPSESFANVYAQVRDTRTGTDHLLHHEQLDIQKVW